MNVQIEGPDVEGLRVLRKGTGTEVTYPHNRSAQHATDRTYRCFDFAIPTPTNIDNETVEHYDAYIVLRLERNVRIIGVSVWVGEEVLLALPPELVRSSGPTWIFDSSWSEDWPPPVPNKDVNTVLKLNLPDRQVKASSMCVSVDLQFGYPGRSKDQADSRVVFIGAGVRFNE